ncbi:MAG: IMP dehydrogenase [Acidobacteria bacterium]|nr:IMP dehydrogenase [Acidobacteriota bacterium]
MLDLEPLFFGRTFDDFLFRPQHSPVATRKDVDLTMPLVPGMGLALPVVGANMDTVVGEEMGKTLALEGAFGFLHRSCPIDVEAARVRYVKTRHSYVIASPLMLPRRATIAEVRALIERHRASGILIEETPGSGVLAGILSQRDLPLGDSAGHRLVEEVMTPRARLVVKSPSVTLEEAEQTMWERRVEKLPLVDEENRVRGLVTMRDLRLFKKKPYSVKDGKGRLRVGAAIGATGDFLERAEALVAAEADAILMDVAHADSDIVARAMRRFLEKFRDVPLVVGNVATREGAAFLAEEGAAAVKVGVGPGRGCRTRLETGAGIPQLQAIREAWLGTGWKVPSIADGGVRNDKDVFLAIACGASTVMLGSLLSGTDESPGIVVEDPATRQKVKLYRGMTSPEAVADGASAEQLTEALSTPAEGQTVRIPYVGSVVGILSRLAGHLKSAVSYSGESSLAAAHHKIAADPARYLVPLSPASRSESFER